jgi:hypothetical protein
VIWIRILLYKVHVLAFIWPVHHGLSIFVPSSIVVKPKPEPKLL